MNQETDGASVTVEDAKQNLEETKEALDNAIAENEQAKADLESAQAALDASMEEAKNAFDSAKKEASDAYAEAQSTIEEAQAAYDACVAEYEEVSAKFEASETALKEAEAAFEQAIEDADPLYDEYDRTRIASEAESAKEDQAYKDYCDARDRMDEANDRLYEMEWSDLDFDLFLFNEDMPLIEAEYEDAKAAFAPYEESFIAVEKSYLAALEQCRLEYPDLVEAILTAKTDFQDAIVACHVGMDVACEKNTIYNEYLNRLNSGIPTELAEANETRAELQESIEALKLEIIPLDIQIAAGKAKIAEIELAIENAKNREEGRMLRYSINEVNFDEVYTPEKEKEAIEKEIKAKEKELAKVETKIAALEAEKAEREANYDAVYQDMWDSSDASSAAFRHKSHCEYMFTDANNALIAVREEIAAPYEAYTQEQSNYYSALYELGRAEKEYNRLMDVYAQLIIDCENAKPLYDEALAEYEAAKADCEQKFEYLEYLSFDPDFVHYAYSQAVRKLEESIGDEKTAFREATAAHKEVTVELEVATEKLEEAEKALEEIKNSIAPTESKYNASLNIPEFNGLETPFVDAEATTYLEENKEGEEEVSIPNARARVMTMSTTESTSTSDYTYLNAYLVDLFATADEVEKAKELVESTDAMVSSLNAEYIAAKLIYEEALAASEGDHNSPDTEEPETPTEEEGTGEAEGPAKAPDTGDVTHTVPMILAMLGSAFTLVFARNAKALRGKKSKSVDK